MSSTSSTATKDATKEEEARECRCMFCGDLFVFKSEGEAIEHMGNCPALQEQLGGSEPITIPKDIKQKMKMDE